MSNPFLYTVSALYPALPRPMGFNNWFDAAAEGNKRVLAGKQIVIMNNINNEFEVKLLGPSGHVEFNLQAMRPSIVPGMFRPTIYGQQGAVSRCFMYVTAVLFWPVVTFLEWRAKRVHVNECSQG